VFELCTGPIAEGKSIGFNVKLYYATDDLEVETELYLDEHPSDPEFQGTTRPLDPWIWSETTNKFYRLEDNKIVEIVDCPSLEDVDCVEGEWTDWSSCVDDSGQIQSCGDGHTRKKSRGIAIDKKNNGKPCEGPFEQEESCDDILPNPTDCVVSDWSSWGECSVECGGGTQTRTRSIGIEATCGGDCPPLEQTQECNAQCCPVDCVLSDWSEWSSCHDATGQLKTCGSGWSRERTRTIVSDAECGGTCLSTSHVMSIHMVSSPIGSIGQGGSIPLHDITWEVDKHVPPHSASLTIVLVLSLLQPEPHVFSCPVASWQLLHSLQSESTQSTGQHCALHS
jgi:hypothetical protein